MLDPIQDAIEEFVRGRMIILVDDEDRENEGDLVMPAQFITPEAVNFMAKHARGLICLTVNNEIANRIGLTPMVPQNQSGHGTAFTVSIEAAEGVTTGISAHDRAHTIQVAVNPKAVAGDIVSPGHVFPLIAKEGGVLVRAGHTEASVDLARMCSLTPAAVICEIMNDDGTMARLPELRRFADEHNIKLCSIADLIQHRMHTDSLVEVVSEQQFDSVFGTPFSMRVYESDVDKQQHIAISTGPIRETDDVLVRMHGEQTLDDLFGTLLHKDPSRLSTALQKIAAQGAGVLVYLRRKPAVDDEEQGQMDLRSYGIGAQILRDLGVGQFTLMTDTPRKIVGLEGFGLHCNGTVPLMGDSNDG